MKDYLVFSMNSSLSQDNVFKLMQTALSDFSWKMGDSDAQGLYVSGVRSDGIYLKVWISENPIKLSMSFNESFKNSSDEALSKKILFDRVSNDVLPNLGVLLELKES
jgi:hypothetical protein